MTISPILTSRSLPDLHQPDSASLSQSPTDWEDTNSPQLLPSPPRSPEPQWTPARPVAPNRTSSSSLRKRRTRSDSLSSIHSTSHSTPLPFERDPNSPPPDSEDELTQEDGPIKFTLHHPSRSDYSIHSAPPELGDHPDFGDLDHQPPQQEEEEDSHTAPEDSTRAPSPSPSSSSGRRYSGRWERTREGSGGLVQLPFSLWDYLQQELAATEMDGEEGVKSERVTNFLTVPGEIEKVSPPRPCARELC